MKPGSTASGLAPGARVCGQYVVERFVRRGALASVFVARATDGRFAVRVIHAVEGAAPASPDRVATFTRTLESVAALGHRAMPQLVGVGVEPAGLVVVSSYPGGMTLRDVVARGARLRPVDVARVVVEAASALEVLHTQTPPVVHRVLMPESIAVSERPVHVWVEECGLAHALATAGLLGPGTPAPSEYRSPCEIQHTVDPRGDVFSLASIAYECLTGTGAFRGEDVEAAILTGPRPLVRTTRTDLSTEVDEVLARAWTLDPAQGYATAGAFAADFARALGASAHKAVAPVVTAQATPFVATPPFVAGMKPEVAQQGARPFADDEVDRAFDEMLADKSSTAEIATPVPPTAQRMPPSAPLPSTRRSTPPPPPPPHARAPRATLVGVAPIHAGSVAAAAAMKVPEPGTFGGAPLAPPATPLATHAPGVTLQGPGVTAPSSTPLKPFGSTQRVAVPRMRPPGTIPSGDAGAVPRVAARAGHPTGDDSWTGPGPRPPQGVIAPVEAGPGAPAIPIDPMPDADDTVPVSTGDRAHPPEAPVALKSELAGWDDIPVTTAASIPPTESAPPVDAPVRVPSLPPEAPDPFVENRVTEPDGSFDIALAHTVSAPLPPALGILAQAFPPPVETPPPPSAPPLALGSLEAPPARRSEPAARAVPVPSPSHPPPASHAMYAPPNASTQPPPAAYVSPSTHFVATPPAPPTMVKVARILGPFILLSALVVTGGQIYIVQANHTRAELRAATEDGNRAPPVAHPPGRAVSPSTPAPVPAVTPTLVDAAVAATPDATAVRDSAAVATADASVEAPARDAETTPVVAATPDATEAPATGSLPRRPHSRDIDHLTDDMETAIFACLPHEHSNRHVRLTVVYTGATGAASEVHVGPPFADPPVGPCIEAVIRAHPSPRFTDETWETRYVYDTD